MATEYRVTGQRQVDRLTPQGSFVPAMEVSFEVIPEGVAGMVTVDERNYTAEFVDAEIQQRVANIKAVHSL
jgi:hypothetical protein